MEEQTPPFPNFEHVVQGAILLDKRVAFILFTRHRADPEFPFTAVMAQTPGGVLYSVEGFVLPYKTEPAILKLRDSRGRCSEFALSAIRNASGDSAMKCLVLACSLSAIPFELRRNPDDLWDPIPSEFIAEAVKGAERERCSRLIPFVHAVAGLGTAGLFLWLGSERSWVPYVAAVPSLYGFWNLKFALFASQEQLDRRLNGDT